MKTTLVPRVLFNVYIVWRFNAVNPVGIERNAEIYRSMLGWHSLFISCTSRSMLALLLARVFILRAITCPVMRCCT